MWSTVWNMPGCAIQWIGKWHAMRLFSILVGVWNTDAFTLVAALTRDHPQMSKTTQLRPRMVELWPRASSFVQFAPQLLYDTFSLSTFFHNFVS
ncbi:hypothetical protein EX30DRAFT_81816 [Ascodesmis nigricans]|uniref:Uncharacterized protein n=1 Tax=Ascodesmis nigricans TaxID=341454 RepID=A0A4S2N308_9PEZI|nr:hypothetical protein EX30DRAFT_81816 [Ascodesmis nigricans]